MKISKSEIDKLIKEEFQKMLEKKKLSTRLSQINEELEKMNQEDAPLSEVETGGKTKVSSHAWTGKENGDAKFEPKFEKKGTHLKEDEGATMEDELNNDASVDTEVSIDAPVEETAPVGEFEAKFAALGKILDAKLAGESSEEVVATTDTTDEEGAEDFEEVEVEDESNITTGEEGATDEETVEVDENKETAPHNPEDHTKQPGYIHQESVEEPIEGQSVAQEVAADTVNDNMEKDTHVKESAKKDGKVITETKTTKGNIFTEGLDDKRKANLLEEFNRMKKFAGLSKDEE